jgi:hypothetical protein
MTSWGIEGSSAWFRLDVLCTQNLMRCLAPPIRMAGELQRDLRWLV